MGGLINEWEVTYSMTKKAKRHRVEEKIKYKCIRFNGLVTELEEHSSQSFIDGTTSTWSENACPSIAGYEHSSG